MKENKDCKVVQDLLPNYIEHLTSEETNQFIEEHLKSCKDCQAMLDSMKAEIKVDKVQQDNREVEYIKKFNVKFKKAEYKFFVLIYTILAILIVGTTVFFGRKYIILKTLANNASKYINSTNYYVKCNNYLGESFYSQEIWVKDGKGRRLATSGGYSVQYITKEEGFYWYNNEELVAFFEGEKDYSVDYINLALEEMQNEFNDIKAIFTHSVETIKLNDKVCYKIKANDVVGSYMYYEKETGLPVKLEMWQIGPLAGKTEIRCAVNNYEYNFDCVEDKDLEFDDGKEKIYEEVTTTAKLGETTNIKDDNLNIEISNVTYDEKNNQFNTDIKFSTVDNKGVSTEIKYEYVIYDANKNIVASSLPIAMDETKRKIVERFVAKYFNEITPGSFIEYMIGIAEQKNNMTEEGKVHHTLTVPNLDKKLNLENLTIMITNIKYKNRGEKEEITPYKDFIFTFN